MPQIQIALIADHIEYNGIERYLTIIRERTEIVAPIVPFNWIDATFLVRFDFGANEPDGDYKVVIRQRMGLQAYSPIGPYIVKFDRNVGIEGHQTIIIPIGGLDFHEFGKYYFDIFVEDKEIGSIVLGIIEGTPYHETNPTA